MSGTMTREQATKAALKIGITFKMLERGLVSSMTDEEVNKLIAWLDA